MMVIYLGVYRCARDSQEEVEEEHFIGEEFSQFNYHERGGDERSRRGKIGG